MQYDPKDLKNTLAIAKSIIFMEEKIVIFKEGKRIELNSKQMYGLLKKLQFYLEVDEKCIDKDGPSFPKETKAP
jgi:hypothetical protein